MRTFSSFEVSIYHKIKICEQEDVLDSYKLDLENIPFFLNLPAAVRTGGRKICNEGFPLLFSADLEDVSPTDELNRKQNLLYIFLWPC